MKLKSEWSGRLKYWLNSLTEDFYHPVGEIAFNGFITSDELTPDTAVKTGHFRPMPEGTEWGFQWEYAWMRSSITIPPEAEHHIIVMNLNPGGESTLFINGEEYGTKRAEWVSVPHHMFSDNILTMDAKSGENFELMLEAYAGHYFPNSKFGGIATGPVMPGAFKDPKEGLHRARVGKSTFGIWNEAAYQLWLDATALYEIFQNLPDGSLRAAKIGEALKKFTLMVDFEQSGEARVIDYQKAREFLRPMMEAHNGSTSPTFYGVGNAHLDVAWLWPIRETVKKTARTFAQQLRLIDMYPGYKFIQSQPHTYKMCKDHYPALYEKIKAAIKKGGWIAEGGMWVEPDTNMSSGESLIRQLLHGKKFYRDEFGVECEMLWLPDTFGYSAALPQILNSFGIKYLVTQKIFWSYNEGEQFPYHYFNWQGLDGSKIVSFLPTNYTYTTNPKQLMDVWENRVQKDNLDKFLLPFGYGDGGGGPSRDYIEFAVREADLEGMPKMKMAHPVEFFKDLEKDGPPENTYVGELYFTCHRGVYTSQAKTKMYNRKAELALREAEMWGAFGTLYGYEYPLTDMDAEWKKVLLNQFHDILPGSSIHRVYEEAETLYKEVLEKSRQETALSCAKISGSGNDLIIFNSLSWERMEVVKLPRQFSSGAKTAEGDLVPISETSDGILALVNVPSCGFVSLMPCDNAAITNNPVSIKQSGGHFILENSLLRAEIDENGEVVSFINKETGFENAAGNMNRFMLYKDVPRIFDAWDIDSPYELQLMEHGSCAKVEILVDSPLECSLRITKSIGNSTITQIIKLSARSPRLDFLTTVDWNELHRLLKVSFPVNVHAEEGHCEIQYGYIKRPTHRSRQYDKDRFEVCNHRYTALCDENHGAAVLNDCKYGVSLNKNEVNLTLLRAPSSPDMGADNGVHNFTYAFTAWSGTFFDSQVARIGYELNTPVTISFGEAKPAHSFLSVDAPQIVVDTVKPAEDGSGDVIVRMYDSKKTNTETVLHFGLPISGVWQCNMEENILHEIPVLCNKSTLKFNSFEVKTLRLRINK